MFEFPDSLDDSAEAINAKITTTDFISSWRSRSSLMTPADVYLEPWSERRRSEPGSYVVAPEHVITLCRRDSWRNSSSSSWSERSLPLQLPGGTSRATSCWAWCISVNELKQGNEAVLSITTWVHWTWNIDRNSTAASVFALSKPEASAARIGLTKDQHFKTRHVTSEADYLNVQLTALKFRCSALERVGNQQDLIN